jgi:hypothetical protein
MESVAAGECAVDRQAGVAAADAGGAGVRRNHVEVVRGHAPDDGGAEDVHAADVPAAETPQSVTWWPSKPAQGNIHIYIDCLINFFINIHANDDISPGASRRPNTG